MGKIVYWSRRFVVNMSLNIGLQYSAELLPTVGRARGTSYVHIAGHAASLLSPYIIDLVSVHQFDQ